MEMLPASCPAPAPCQCVCLCVCLDIAACVYVLTLHQIKAICCTRSKGGHKNSSDKSAWPPPLTADGCRFHATLHTYTQHTPVWKPVAAFIYFPTNLSELNTYRDAYAQRGEPGRLPVGPASRQGQEYSAKHRCVHTQSTSKALLSLLSHDEDDVWNYIRGTIGLWRELGFAPRSSLI